MAEPDPSDSHVLQIHENDSHFETIWYQTAVQSHYISSSAPSPSLAMENRPPPHLVAVEEDEDVSDAEDNQPGGISLMMDVIDDGAAPLQDQGTSNAAPTNHWTAQISAPIPLQHLSPPSIWGADSQSLHGNIWQPNNGPHHIFNWTDAQHQYLATDGFLDADYNDYPEYDAPAVPGSQQFQDICRFFNNLKAASYARPDKTYLHGSLEDVKQPMVITQDGLDGDRCDFQGINWEEFNTTRRFIRSERNRWQREKQTQYPRSFRETKPVSKVQPARCLPDTGNYFSFRRMNTRHRVSVPHFQLRNLLIATSRSDIYYAANSQIMHTDASGRPETCVVDLTGNILDTGSYTLITSLAASDDVLIAGGFNGEYALLNLNTEYGTPPTLGRATNEHNGITNHVHTFRHRTSGSSLGAFCSNDRRLRILDCATDQFIYNFSYDNPINCSATSPNGRMRVVVGDFHEALVTNAETGVPFQTLPAHTDDVFACAWADDGIHIATGAQDSKVIVWDARWWGRPLSVIQSELSIPRSLRFSPVGGGPRVLLSAEADDFVNVIDAITFEERQVFDFFGPTGGMALTPDGSSLFIANTDQRLGGIMEFERIGFGQQRKVRRWLDDEPEYLRSSEEWDWIQDEALELDPRVELTKLQRWRRGLSSSEMVL